MIVQASMVVRLAARGACLPPPNCFTQRTSAAPTARLDRLVSMCLRHRRAGEVQDSAG